MSVDPTGNAVTPAGVPTVKVASQPPITTVQICGPMSSCSMGMDGQTTMSDDGHTMTGTYSGNMSGMMSGGMMNQSCGGPMNNGHFTLTR